MLFLFTASVSQSAPCPWKMGQKEACQQLCHLFTQVGCGQIPEEKAKSRGHRGRLRVLLSPVLPKLH